MARKLTVEIIGDASSLERSFRSAGHETESFGTKLGHTAKIASLALGAAAIGGLALVLGESVKAAMAGQTAQAALDASLRATHQSVKAMTPALEEAAASARKMGFTDVEAETALSRLEVATGNTKQATSDLGVAMDIARFKHTDLTNASQMLAMAMTGSQRAAKQLGITVSPVTTNLDALKASHENLTTAAGKADEAEAKLQDKMATGQAVIAAVTEKVHGQAQAYSETAAGGMAVFSAQLEFMEQQIGNALLPVLTRTLVWVNQHWPEMMATFKTVFDAIGRGVDYVKPYLEEFIAFSERVVARVKADWPQISAEITKVMNTAKAIIDGTVTAVEAVWRRFGGAITTIATTAFNTVIRVIKDDAAIIGAVFSMIGDLIHGRWAKAWDDLKTIVSHAFDAVLAILSGEAKIVYTEAIAIGRAIIDGIGAGITGLASSIAGKLKSAVGGAISSVKGAFGIHSPSTVTQKEIGEPLAAGVILGFVTGIQSFAPKAAAAMHAAVGFVAADARRGADEIIQTFEGITEAATKMVENVHKAITNASGILNTNGQPIADWMLPGLIDASNAANPNAAGANGSLFTYGGGNFDWSTVPGNGGMPAAQVNVTVNGWVGSDQQIAQKLKAELVTLGKMNVTSGF